MSITYWWPLGVTGVYCYDSFGRTGYIKSRTNPRGYHWAQDFSARKTSKGYVSLAGAPIKLLAAGKVVENGWNHYWGWYLRVNTRDGDSWLYAHMKHQSPLRRGTYYNSRVLVGYVGQTGNVTGPHLHIEHWKGQDGYRDPRYNPFYHFNPRFPQRA